ncbi:MAG: glycosyltransferase family 4 protein [Mucilaginibacter sp.]|uniref:glycosyltransferase family 4 protein n=1 Tax=Mucilaginibacter sp. TaxID=1882438 RepID=UPI003267C172
MNTIPNKIYQVCFATLEYPPDIGGIGKSAKRITKFLSQENFDVHIFTPIIEKEKAVGEYTSKFEDSKTIYRINTYGSSDVDKVFKHVIQEIDAQIHFDIFHGFYLFKAFPCIEIADGKRPVIASFRGIDAYWMRQPDLFSKTMRILNEATWITSVSKDILKLACSLKDISSNSSFLPNSINQVTEESWKLNCFNRGVVGTVATFRPKKNIPLLLDAYAHIDVNIRKKVLLVGDFMLNRKKDWQRERSFKKMLEYYDITKEVEVTGIVDNDAVNDYLRRMNVFVLSSIHEGLPNSILEAAAIGLPIVSTAIDGIKDVFEHKKNALLVPEGDMIALRNAVSELLRNDDLAYELSMGAIELSLQLSPNKEGSEWLNLYHSLLK